MRRHFTPAAEILFEGPLAEEMTKYAACREKDGIYHITPFAALQIFGRFLALKHPRLDFLSRTIVSEWFVSVAHLSSNTQAHYRGTTFSFCTYLRRKDPRVACPEDFASFRKDRSFRPHVYSVNEIAALLKAARELSPWPSPLRPRTFELILALLYCLGLRIGETIRIDMGDYDQQEGTLLIRKTKFGKTRLVPMSGSCHRLLEAYIEKRQHFDFDANPSSPLICSLNGSKKRACLGSVQNALAQLLRQCGVKLPKGRGSARIHDIRHTFAAHRVLQWYRAGVDVQAHLPHLATYMGHRAVESTQAYLNVIPGVLEEASGRLARFAATALKERQE